MARITEAALDGPELARLKADRSQQQRSPVAGASVLVASGLPLVSLALIVGGVGAVLAPAPLPFPVDMLGLGAVAIGGWLAGRGDRSDGVDKSRDAMVEGIVGATLLERRDVIRAAVAIAAVRGDDAAARRAVGALQGQVPREPREAGEDGGGAGRAVLHAVERAGASAGESLEPGADADALNGGG